VNAIINRLTRDFTWRFLNKVMKTVKFPHVPITNNIGYPVTATKFSAVKVSASGTEVSVPLDEVFVLLLYIIHY
jgi:hypothetical protein